MPRIIFYQGICPLGHHQFDQFELLVLARLHEHGISLRIACLKQLCVSTTQYAQQCVVVLIVRSGRVVLISTPAAYMRREVSESSSYKKKN